MEDNKAEPTVEEVIKFGQTIHPLFKEMFEMANTSQEQLEGSKVISIVSGYSGSPGRVMEVDEVMDGVIHFSDADKSSMRTWASRFDERSREIVMYTLEAVELIRKHLV